MMDKLKLIIKILRWIFFIPIGFWTANIVSNSVTFVAIGFAGQYEIKPIPFWFFTPSRLIWGYFFVWIGTLVAPKKEHIAAIILFFLTVIYNLPFFTQLERYVKDAPFPFVFITTTIGAAIATYVMIRPALNKLHSQNAK